MSKDERFMEWQAVYLNQPVESMPWYSKDLDPDLAAEIKERKLKQGKFLDIGSGPGTQAAALAKMGFDVTGIDISEAAIEQAEKKFPDVKFILDDILNTKLNTKFDYIFDRGCFHVISPEDRQVYLMNLLSLLKTNSILFLKTFSKLVPETGFGPYRFSIEMIEGVFSPHFEIEKYYDSGFEGPDGSVKFALFIVMKRK